MNLAYMHARADKNLAIDGGVTGGKASIEGESWRGLDLAAGGSIRIRAALRFFNFRAWPDTCGWYALLPADAPDLEITIRSTQGDHVLGRSVLRAGSPGMVPVRLPWPAERRGDLDLVVRALPSPRVTGRATILSTRLLERSGLVARARGVGVEIGPGPQPQIVQSGQTHVSYVEQMPPAEWNRLYNPDGNYPVRPDLWDKYVIGDASDLPFAAESLDFIFASHVFEHLVNPIGHLKRWAETLRSGGVVLCIVPELSGARDYFQRPSTLSEWEREFVADIWEPDLSHYMRFMRTPGNHPKLVKAMEERASIHAHFYTNMNCEPLLEHACAHLGFASWSMTWTPNHKDFYFSLVKA